MTSMNPIFVIGSINTDMVATTSVLPKAGETVMGNEFIMTAGGKGANQAVAAARMGGDATMIGRLGEDIFGEQSLKRLRGENINCSHISIDPNQASGIALINVDDQGENHIVVVPGANGTLTNSHIESILSDVPDEAVILLQLEIPIETVAFVISSLRNKKRKIILDPAPACELSPSFMDGVYLVTPNETEATLLSGINVSDRETASEAAKKISECGPKNVAITMGADGVLFLSEDNKELFITPPRVKAIDTTAAGDCFNGSLAVMIASGMNVKEAIEQASIAASISVTRSGAQDSMPFRHELN